jgi:hypothetical protein
MRYTSARNRKRLIPEDSRSERGRHELRDRDGTSRPWDAIWNATAQSDLSLGPDGIAVKRTFSLHNLVLRADGPEREVVSCPAC